MKRLLTISSMIILLASCDQEAIEPAQQITGMYALDNGTGLTNEYINFDKGKLSVCTSLDSYPLAENYIWDNGIPRFKLISTDKYSIRDGKYITSYSTSKGTAIAKDDDGGLIFGTKSYVRLDGFKKEPYSSILLEGDMYEKPLQAGEYSFPITVINPIAVGKLTVKSSSSWISEILINNGWLRYQLSSTKTPREGMITLSYTHAKDVQITIRQTPVIFIRLSETSKTVGYAGASVEIPYTVENLLSGAALTVSSSADWVECTAVDRDKVIFNVQENNSTASRTAKLTFSYEGAEDVQFSLTQEWSASSIDLTPSSETFDYAGGSGSFTFKVQNPREGIACTAQSQENWISNVSESGNTVSYKVNENNTGATRIGKIQLKYGTYAVVEFTVKQEWAASEIVLTPSSETFNYTGGSGTLSFEVLNPREGVVCVVKSQESWISNVVKTSGNSASYGVKANNSATARTGKIIITYGIYAAAEFVVTQSGQPVTSVALNKTNLALHVGESETLVATVVPSDAELTWESNNPSVASVINGTVKATENGTAIITVKSKDGNKSATCKVTVTTAVTGVSLNKTTLSLASGQSEMLVATVLPTSASDKSVTWTSSKPSVATVNSSGVVTAVSVGTAVITVTTTDGGFTAECTVTVKAVPPMTELGKTFVPVDLGLPSGLKWASFNLGASSPGQYGNYYAWGETVPKANYGWSTYKWCMNGSSSQLTKYCSSSSRGYNGFTDNKTVLDPEDDTAAVALGGSWRMATYAEWDELKTKCTWTWTTQNGKKGRLVTGPNGNSIFLPAAGCRYGTSLYNAGSGGYYWSSSLYTDSPYCAYFVRFNSDNVLWYFSSRDYGFSVRPVSE